MSDEYYGENDFEAEDSHVNNASQVAATADAAAASSVPQDQPADDQYQQYADASYAAGDAQQWEQQQWDQQQQSFPSHVSHQSAYVEQQPVTASVIGSAPVSARVPAAVAGPAAPNNPSQPPSLQSSRRAHPPQPHESLAGNVDPASLPFRPIVPPFLHPSLNLQHNLASQPPHPSPPLTTGPIDPRSTPDYQVAWELELWRRTEVKAQQERWKAEEAARMRILEEEFAKGVKAEEAKLQLRILKIQQSEKAAQQGALELEKQRAALRLQQNELASRVASLDKELAKHKGDCDAYVARMKDQTAYEVAKAKAQLKDSVATHELLRKELKSSQSKLAEAREEHEKDKLKHAKSNFGAVEAQLRKKEDELATMTEKWKTALSERDYEKGRLAAALSKGMALYKQIEDLKTESLELKNKDADYLRQQYMAKERQVGAQRSVSEAHEIMKQVKAHLSEMAGPTRTNVTDMPPHQPQTFQYHNTAGSNLSASVPSHSTAHSSFNSFNPLPQTHASSVVAPSSLAARVNSVPEPYQFLVHEQEMLNKVKHENALSHSSSQKKSTQRHSSSTVTR